MILRVHFAGQFVNLETSLSILYEFALMSKKGFIGLDLFSAFKFSTIIETRFKCTRKP